MALGLNKPRNTTLKIIGFYQIAGILILLGSVIYTIFGSDYKIEENLMSHFIIILICLAALFISSELIKATKLGIIGSFTFQLLQTVWIAAGDFEHKFYTLLALYIGTDYTESKSYPIFELYFLSDLKWTISSGEYDYGILFNFIAIPLCIYLLIRWVNKDKILNRCSQCGQLTRTPLVK